ncbi:hypothetical protein P3W85_42525 [Cupriavidus basilensis]|uniref:PilN domain-containing protein n=1 Tax=Cupriavidus basilensis TaxID=68895 RepID=A0ABT6B3W2_9BURK|nr:hypothetical protein [Cupriavidus basilensis]MDF3839569.1 hypothetical protein [Cupriavidus basilensis]
MMPQLKIDFSRRPSAVAPAGVVLLIVAGAMLLLGARALWRAYQDNDHARNQFEMAVREDISRKPPKKAAPTPGAKLAEKQGEAILRELTVPWQRLLSIVEDYPGHDIALIGIDQSPAQSQIRITAEAKDADGMIAYLKYLQGSVLLHEAVLSGHLVETNVPGTPVRFQIIAVWRKP